MKEKDPGSKRMSRQSSSTSSLIGDGGVDASVALSESHAVHDPTLGMLLEDAASVAFSLLRGVVGSAIGSCAAACAESNNNEAWVPMDDLSPLLLGDTGGYEDGGMSTTADTKKTQ